MSKGAFWNKFKEISNDSKWGEIDSENLAKAYRKLKIGEDALKRYFILATSVIEMKT